jgi:hypothetical protein
MRRNIMKKFSVLIAFLVFISVSCNEVEFSRDDVILENSVVSVKVDPPVATPGTKIAVSVAVDDGRGEEPLVDISVGNMVFAGKTTAEFTIPDDVSTLFGDDTAAEIRRNGYADVSIEVGIRNSGNNAVKMFRIAGSGYKPDSFGVNPEISQMEYDVTGSAQKISIEKGSSVVFSPSSVPKEVSFIPEKTVVDDVVKDDYVFSWFVSGVSAELPEVVEFDKDSGKIIVNFRDLSDAPLIGTYKFFAVLKPVKSLTGTDAARYGSDFFSFTVDTGGE